MVIQQKKLQIQQEKQLKQAARELLSHHSDKRIFAFFGAMGVGKTTFIKAICRELGVRDVVGSPTFSIVNQYADADAEPVYHFDFYRIRKLDEVYDMGYEEYLYSGAYCLIEWPEKMQSLLPANSTKVFMEEKNGERIIKF
ncbi:MAG: tRNA (adenosine(37)-N6)-threonylcarbamoyltransferase complex ATPase subunit type 1 TsaE [Bacteroidales bacterium]